MFVFIHQPDSPDTQSHSVYFERLKASAEAFQTHRCKHHHHNNTTPSSLHQTSHHIPRPNSSDVFSTAKSQPHALRFVFSVSRQIFIASHRQRNNARRPACSIDSSSVRPSRCDSRVRSQPNKTDNFISVCMLCCVCLFVCVSLLSKEFAAKELAVPE